MEEVQYITRDFRQVGPYGGSAVHVNEVVHEVQLYGGRAVDSPRLQARFHNLNGPCVSATLLWHAGFHNLNGPLCQWHMAAAARCRAHPPGSLPGQLSAQTCTFWVLLATLFTLCVLFCKLCCCRLTPLVACLNSFQRSWLASQMFMETAEKMIADELWDDHMEGRVSAGCERDHMENMERVQA
eukprot:1156725-Pelagomonas_calceolata.AAC.7